MITWPWNAVLALTSLAMVFAFMGWACCALAGETDDRSEWRRLDKLR